VFDLPHCGRKDRSKCAADRAFSSIELLTVVALLAIVLLLTAPSLELARQRTRLATCLDRLGAIATASRAYAAEDTYSFGIPVHPLFGNPDHTPFIGAYEWGGKSGVGRPGYWQGGNPADPLTSRYGTCAGFGPASRPLNNYFYPHGFRENRSGPFECNRIGATKDTQLELNAFRCPADDGPPAGGHCSDWLSNPQTSSYDHFGTSFAANIYMINSQGGNGALFSNSPYLRPLSRVPFPARTIFYEENIGRWAWASREDQCEFFQGIDPGPTKAIRGWHGKDWNYNRSFGDGHAEYQTVYVEGTEDHNGYAWHFVSEELTGYPPFDFDSDGTPDSEGSFESYRCIIVRGPGWAKDTLPASLIPTGLFYSAASRPSYEDCVGE